MSKINNPSNPRVIIEVGVFGPSKDPDKRKTDYRRACENMIAEIKRHIDDVDGIHFDWDNDVTCSHCGYAWEDDPVTKEPMCCQKAVDEYNQSQTSIV